MRGSVKMLMWGFVWFAMGLAATVAGFNNDDPETWLAPLKWFGPCLLVLGLLLAGISVFRFSSR